MVSIMFFMILRVNLSVDSDVGLSCVLVAYDFWLWDRHGFESTKVYPITKDEESKNAHGRSLPYMRKTNISESKVYLAQLNFGIFIYKEKTMIIR